jgi:hypothetical protein
LARQKKNFQRANTLAYFVAKNFVALAASMTSRCNPEVSRYVFFSPETVVGLVLMEASKNLKNFNDKIA